MFRLIVDNAQRADAYLPVSWCIGDKEREIIEKFGIIHPHVLLVVASVYDDPYYSKTSEDEQVESFTEKSRYLVPLTAGTKYITFNRPGRYRLYASIVGDNFSSIKELRKKFLDRGKGGIDWNGHLYLPKPFLGRAELDINVGREFFAPEPSEWEQKYMSLWPPFRNTPNDQCAWRKRRIFAYTLLPILLGIWWPLRGIIGLILYLLGASFGIRGFAFTPVWNPNRDFLDIFGESLLSDSIFFRNENGTVQGWRLIFHPWIGVLSLILTRVIFGKPVTLWMFVKHLVAIYGIAFLVLPILAFLVYKMIQQVVATYRKSVEVYEMAVLKSENENLSLVQCETVTAYGGHPPRETLTLKFNGIKAKVCRPFSR